jgi:hypothetical protein
VRGFDALLSADQSLPFQQTLALVHLSVIIANGTKYQT